MSLYSMLSHALASVATTRTFIFDKALAAVRARVGVPPSAGLVWLARLNPELRTQWPCEDVISRAIGAVYPAWGGPYTGTWMARQKCFAWRCCFPPVAIRCFPNEGNGL